MTTSRMRSLATLTAAAAVVMLASAPAGADDTELFVGAAVAAALEIGGRAGNEGKNIVIIIPSFAERYLSTALFEGL